MHDQSYEMMEKFRETYMHSVRRVLDVGSQMVMGEHAIQSYRNLFPREVEYIGLDVEEGESVDVVVTPDCEKWPFEDESFDAVISGQCLEHTRKPWVLAAEMGRVVKPGGVVAIIVPWMWEEHLEDYWRFSHRGLAVLAEVAGITPEEKGHVAHTTQVGTQVVVRTDSFLCGIK